MNVFIARDGAEIGEYPRAQLEDAARVGRLRPSDYYWYEGMETWLLLGDLLSEEAWKPKKLNPKPKFRKDAEEVVTAPIPTTARVRLFFETFPDQLVAMRTQFMWLGGILLVFFLTGLVAVVLINTSRANRPVVPPTLDFAKAAESTPVDPVVSRDQAAADLRQRIERLPDKPTPPRYTFYYDISVNMRRSFADGTTWIAIVRGGENVVDPQTQTTNMHTDFVLNAEYRDGEWLFQHYRASVSDMVKQITTEIDDDQKAPAPPSIVGELGLKIRAE